MPSWLSGNVFTCQSGRMARAARIEDFSLTDLLTPKPGRTLRILSAIINFLKYVYEECLGNVEKMEKFSERKLVERDRLRVELQARQKEFDEIKSFIAFCCVFHLYSCLVGPNSRLMNQDAKSCV